MESVTNVPHERLAMVMKANGLTDPAVAEAVGTTKQQIFKLRKGELKLSPEWAKRLAPVVHVDWTWLLGSDMTVPVPTGGGKTTGFLDYVTKSLALNSVDEGGGDGIEYRGRAYAPLPVFDVMVSAGPGSFNRDRSIPEGWSLLSLDQIRSVTRASTDDLAIIRVSGDSMAPTLQNGDQILIDRTIHRIGRDGMYVIATGEEVIVKRISRDWASKSLTISSDNPLYPTSHGVQEEDIVVLGRVVWISRNVGG